VDLDPVHADGNLDRSAGALRQANSEESRSHSNLRCEFGQLFHPA